MQAKTQRHRRPRNKASKSTGILVRTEHDVRGIAEPLDRYGELLACQIVGLYNAIHRLSPDSDHARARLGRLFHECEGLPSTGKILTRPAYQWRYGYNHQTIYRRTPGTNRFLNTWGLQDAAKARWASRTRIVPVGDAPDQEPPMHDSAVSVLMSSMEIEVRQSAYLRFVSHLDIIENASAEAQAADCPLAIPCGDLTYTFPNGKSASLSGIHVKPDAFFGIGYPPENDHEYRFFALEYDRGTEDVEPSGSLMKASWLRKVLSYSLLLNGARPIYQTYLRVPSFFVLCVFCDRVRMENVMDLVDRRATCPEQFLFKTVSSIDPLTTPGPLREVFGQPWETVDGEMFISVYDKE
jgi:hypothetical protein